VVAAIRGWALWRMPRRGAVFVLTVIALPAVALPLVAADDQPFRWADVRTLLELSLIAVASIEVARRVGLPRLVRGRPYRDLGSVWLFAIALLLPAAYVVVASAVLVPLLVRGVLPATYRRAFNAAGLALAGLTAHEVLRSAAGQRALSAAIPTAADGRLVWALLAALASYELVNIALVALAIRLAEPGVRLRQAVGDTGTLVADLTALALGLLAALAWSVSPWLVLAVVPPVVLLQRALIHEELREAAETDGKTGLATAVHWLGLARRCVERAAHGDGACALLLLDVDHFKSVNDTWGHLVGDDVLAQVAGTLRRDVRPGDLVGRLGGEEFGVLLPDTGLVEAAAVAERLRVQVAGRPVPVSTAGWPAPRPDAGRTARVTVSVGVASTAEIGYVLDDLLASADAALYRAKAGGRNRVEIGGPVDASERLWLSHVPAGALGGPPRPRAPRPRAS
jgi:diguanylate cyclase (GGDEF)-like protein